MFKQVLVTGGAGFIGSQLVEKILPYSQHIYVIDNLSTGSIDNLPISDKITMIEGCITDETLLKSILPKVEYIFHLACSNLFLSVTDLKSDFDTNLYGQFQLLQSVQTHCPNIKRFVYTSTTSVYSDAPILPTPETYYNIKLPYAASKFSAEHYCSVYYHMFHLPVTILRLSNVYGPGQSAQNPYCGVIAKFFEAATNKQPLIIFDTGQQTRDFIYIEDALDAILLTASKEAAIGQVYNIGSGIETSVMQLAEKIIKIVGTPNTSVQLKPKRTIDIVKRRSIDAHKIKQELHWKPKHSLHEGLVKTYEWISRGGISK